MKKLKVLFSGVVCFFSMNVSAQELKPIEKMISESEIITVKTVPIKPVEITFLNDQYSGRLIFDSSLDFEKINFLLLDKNQAVVWSNESYRKDQAKERKGFFIFDLLNIELRGDYLLQTHFIDKYGKKVAEGERSIDFIEGEEKFLISDLSVIDELKTVNVKAVFHNDLRFKKLKLKANVFKNNLEKTLVDSFEGELSNVGASAKKELAVSFKKDFLPGRYFVETTVIDVDGNILSGALSYSFFMPGEFLTFDNLEVLTNDFEINKKVKISFSGKLGDESLKEQVLMADLQIFNGAEQVLLKTIELGKVQSDYNGVFDITFSRFISQFSGELVIRRGETVFVTKSFESPLFKEKEIKPVVKTVEKEVVQKTKMDNSKKVFLMIAFLVLLFGFVFFNFKKSFHIWVLGFLLFPSFVFAIGSPFVNWYHPINTWAFNPNNTEGFQLMRLEAEMFNDVTYQPFFEVGTIDEYRVKFTQGATEKEYLFTPSVSVDERKMLAELDLSQEPVKTDLTDGDWNVQYLVHKNGTWYGTTWTGVVTIDKTPPSTLAIDYKKQDGVTSFLSGEFTNSPIKIEVSCVDGGVGCSNLNFPLFEVKGNFCANASDCNHTAIRNFKVCDKVGNCNDSNEVTIDWYDPLPPDINLFNLFLDGATSGTMKASGIYKSQLQYTDPTSVNSLHSDFDADACGIGDVTSLFFQNTTYCEEKEVSCVIDSSHRGTMDRSIPTVCSGSCGVGYFLSNGFCIPNCSTLNFDPLNICFPIDLSF